MSPQWLLFVIVFVFYGFQAKARICQEGVEARNTWAQLEKRLRGCTAVIGNLRILLLDHPNEGKVARNVSFPELTEITGYLLLFRVLEVTTLGNLFPNLAVIRGNTLFLNYSLVIYSVDNLEEIGLYNLRHIGRGSTRIERCPYLCYADTIDWSTIGGPSHSFDYFNENDGDCKVCPKTCNGLCWNENNCQVREAGKCDPKCAACSRAIPDQCSVCGFSSYLNEGKCVSQCPKNKLKNSFTYTCITEEECVNISGGTWWGFHGECVEDCPIGYMQVTEAEGWCKYCADSSCKKICDGGYIESIQRADRFRKCTHIKGTLEIHAYSTVLAEDLENVLENVIEIEGYLKIYRSGAITSLNFLKKLKVIQGMELYKGKYALSVYENRKLLELWNRDNFALQIERGTIYFHNNAMLCPSEIEKFVDLIGFPRNYTSFDVSPYTNGDERICNYVDLKVNVTEVTSTNATVNWEDLADVMVVGYMLHYTEDHAGNMDSFHNHECFTGSWLSESLTNNSSNYHIQNLSPYTQYAFYIQAYNVHASASLQTTVQRFTTLSGEPTEPANVEIIEATTDSITLTWDPPDFPNGVLTKYEIRANLQNDDRRFFAENNYCLQPNLEPSSNFDEADNNLELYIHNSTECCKKQKWKEPKETRFKRFGQSFDTILPAHWNEYELTDLQHFRIYVVLFRVCNDLPACSGAIMIYQRTLPKEGADDIPPGISVAVNKSNVFIKWLEPTDPNSYIASYIVEYWRTDLEYSVPTSECVMPQDYKNSGYGYNIKNLLPGYYALDVKAASLAGLGKSSETVKFQIAGEITPSQNFTFAYFIAAIAIFVLVGSGLFAYSYYKTRKWILLTKAHSTETLYIEDYYELLQKDLDLDIPTDTQADTFGIICNGFIKTQNRPCTIKFGQKYTHKHELAKFLKDAATMKISNAHHVVNLLGIVSKEQPPLIVMELMAWGDLKSFLRSSEDAESTNITHAEMYRMAAEIADGMMYLASKKYVHWDLAARNCMVSAGHTVKIVNFGITQDLYKTDYYKKESGECIPVRWMAPESLADGVFTTDSNVWSYGIILWEIATLAEQPYKNLSDVEVQRFVIGQNIIEQPPRGCPDLLYEMMVACWRWRPKHRPLFDNLLAKLQSNVRRDFRLVSFYHSREGKAYRKSTKEIREYNPPAMMASTDELAFHWNKQDDEVQLLQAEGPSQRQSRNLPSTSK